MSGEKAVTRQHLQDSLEAVLQALDAAGERLGVVEGDTPFLRTLAEAHELGAELLRWSKVRDDVAELVEAVDTFLSRLEGFLGATGAALEAWENGTGPNIPIPVYSATAARLATSGGELRAALARVKGGER